mmetsp:Transcript_3766/g.5132  ORF Transcript_3766/g.5132 Transcript_3766/m.5132 type:complete len:356 (+) Transcript_3766:2809-3876(+)
MEQFVPVGKKGVRFNMGVFGGDIQEIKRISRTVRKSKISIGCIHSGPIHMWLWFTNLLGNVQWTYHKAPKLIHGKDLEGSKHNWLSCTLDSLLSSQPVNVLLFDLVWSNLENIITCDKFNKLNFIVWCNVNKKKFVGTDPPGWKVSWHKVVHSQLGGVTSGLFVMRCCRGLPLKEPWFASKDKGIAACLEDVLDKTNGVGHRKQKLDEVMEQESNTFKAWKRRRSKVFAQTVYNKVCAAERFLDPKEILKVLDIPAYRAREFKDDDQKKLFGVKVPGKVLVWMLEALKRILVPPIVENDSPQPQQVCGAGQEVVVWPSVSVNHSRLLKLLQAADTVSDKAVKADDAKVPVHMWDC